VLKDDEVQATVGASSYPLNFLEGLRKKKTKNVKQDIRCTCADSSGAYPEEKQKR
jgi:hypothetical protein